MLDEVLVQNYESSLLAIRNMPFIEEILANKSVVVIKSLNEAPLEPQKNYKRPLEFSGSEHENLDNL